jgi:heme/copper-type cytochrome/quinol oxidase subunit 3
MFILSETGFFGVLILSYLYYQTFQQQGPSPKELNLLKTGIFSLCLFASSFTIWRSEASLGRGSHRGMLAWLGATILLGAVFIVGQGFEYWDLFQSGARVGSNLFTASFFTLTGFHGLHVIVGLVALLIMLGLGIGTGFIKSSPKALEAVGLYWHFVDVVWVFVLTVVYILPLLK